MKTPKKIHYQFVGGIILVIGIICVSYIIWSQTKILDKIGPQKNETPLTTYTYIPKAKPDLSSHVPRVPKTSPTVIASSTNGYKLVTYSIQDSPIYKETLSCISTKAGYSTNYYSSDSFLDSFDRLTDTRLEYKDQILIPSLKKFTPNKDDDSCLGPDVKVFSWPTNGRNLYVYSHYIFESDMANPGFSKLYKISLADYSVRELRSTEAISETSSPEEGYLFVPTFNTISLLPDGEHLLKWTTSSIYLIDLNADSVSTLYTAPAQDWLVKRLYAGMETEPEFNIATSGNLINFGIYSRNTSASGTPVTMDQYGNYNSEKWNQGIVDMRPIKLDSIRFSI